MSQEQSTRMYFKLHEHIFFSNYFYGFCAVALSVEATLQQRVLLNGMWYFFLIFIATILYYSHPYIRKCPCVTSNRRTNWYTQHYTAMRWNQKIITGILIVSLVLFLWNHWKLLLNMSVGKWILIFIFPFIAALYYGIDSISGKYNLRKIGWLKPFIIGFTWAGLVTVYPVLYYDIINNLEYTVTQSGGLLFFKNFMFITVLCIMFDIKDYAADCMSRVRTCIVKMGLRKTIFNIVIPLSVLGLGSFMYYAIAHHFHQIKVLLNIIPFILLVFVARSLHRRRPLMYYLVIVDGLMLIKAICGSIAMMYF